MTLVPTPTGREALRESRIALAAVVCGVALAGVLGLVGPRIGPAARVRAATAAVQAPDAARALSGLKTRWEAGLLHASHVGAPQPASRDQVDPGGVGARTPTPFVPRLDTLRALLARYDARVLAHAQRLLARALPPRLTPLADRPRTVNCPAQGPPSRA